MRVVQVVGTAVELNYMWLPTWLGQNHQFQVELEKKLRSDVEGRPLTDEVLDDINTKVIDFVVKKYPITGLFDYLDGLKFVEI